MYTSTIVTAALAAAVVNAAAIPGAASAAKRQQSYEQAIYWGQNDAERDLSSYCDSSEGVDIIVLAFLYNYGNGAFPSGNFGNECSIDGNGNPSGCDNLASQIQSCQSAGKKIFVSIGGAANNGAPTSGGDADGIAYSLWNAYGGKSASDGTTPRPFGDVSVDGWDFDIETSNGQENYAELITKLRSYFGSDTSKTYYISGAPQCPIPEPNMGSELTSAQFDYLFIQFYNNYCSANGNSFNFGDWPGYLANGPSSGAKLLIGLPASEEASTGDDGGAAYYLRPQDMANIVNGQKGKNNFAGVMLWDAGNSDSPQDSNCHYSQNVRSVLDSGNTC